MRRLSSLVVSVLSLVIAFGALTLVAGEARTAPYSRIVDNANKARFSAPGWGVSTYMVTRYGKDYGYANPSAKGKTAVYRFDIPAKAKYTVFARWPANSGYNAQTRIGILTKSGLVWKTVNQRKNGNKWMNLGTYKLKGGNAPVVRVSRKSKSKGYVIADAVKVVAGRGAPSSGGSGGSGGGNGDSGGGPSGGKTGAAVLKEARTWLGVPYKYGGTSRNGVDCSGLTYSVFKELGVDLPRTAAAQYSGGPGAKVGKSELKRGYLVFGYPDGGSGIEHVGIITGDGRMINAPVPGTVVRYDQLPASWYNIVGVKKIFPAS